MCGPKKNSENEINDKLEQLTKCPEVPSRGQNSKGRASAGGGPSGGEEGVASGRWGWILLNHWGSCLSNPPRIGL